MNTQNTPDKVTVSAAPVKRFFVEMLTRDIAVEDAIMDLLDNCVDGAIRSSKTVDNLDKPYHGYHVEIVVKPDSFEITDNCGGIPVSERNRAFRMGRPPYETAPAIDVERPLVGVYGIGMKRAVFKMGNEIEIVTQNGKDAYRVPITSTWLNDQTDWDLDVLPVEKPLAADGTVISIRSLHESITTLFSSVGFIDLLRKKIRHHYAIIIQKGLIVSVNTVDILPDSIQLRFSNPVEGQQRIAPYVFTTDTNGVFVFVTVGLRDPIMDQDEDDQDQESPRFSSHRAGWTIICNDRVVLYCNTDEQTGWGTGGVPRYHTQFIAISGVVEFKGDAASLPTTTTKRGLDFSSAFYQQVLNFMREGVLIFTKFTNDWKSREEEAKSRIDSVQAVTYEELKQKTLTSHSVPLRAVSQSPLGGQRFKPILPKPETDSPDVRLSYFREKIKMQELAERLIPDLEDVKVKDVPKKVGEATFDYAYEALIAKGATNK
jgi:hypothetical protein